MNPNWPTVAVGGCPGVMAPRTYAGITAYFPGGSDRMEAVTVVRTVGVRTEKLGVCR
jgi:hypothetical protein